MAWQIEYDPGALQDLKKLDRAVQREIIDYMDNRIANPRTPKDFGKPLRGSRFGLWRYRVRDYRIICELQEKRLVVLVVAVGHRSTIYDDQLTSSPFRGGSLRRSRMILSKALKSARKLLSSKKRVVWRAETFSACFWAK